MASLQLYVSSRPAALAFELSNKPEAQPRPGSRQNCRYNPKKALLLGARDKIANLIESFSPPNHRRNVPLFPEPHFLSVEVVFHWPRPRSHMARGGSSVLGRIDSQFEKCFPKKKDDVDNLAKFILDAMTGPVYSDDSQVAKLTVIKVHDNEDTCEGRTEVKITEIVSLDQLTMP